MFGEKIIDDGEHEILHLRIGHIEHELRAATPEFEFASSLLEHPVGMLLIEF